MTELNVSPFATDLDLRARNRATVERYLSMNGQERLERYQLFAEDGRGGLATTDDLKPMQAVGREALRNADAFNSEFFPDWRWWDIEIFETQDPNRFWAECMGGGQILFPAYPPGKYENRYIHSFELRDGLIVNYLEYMNPCAEMRALGIPVPKVERPSFGM